MPRPSVSLGESAPERVHEVAARGIHGASGPLPHLDTLQRSFGAHDLSQIKSHTGEVATESARAMGAEAFTAGEHVAFAGPPSLHTAAHEAAHVIQQRAGVALPEGIGHTGDAYEQNADAVADRVVQGTSTVDLLPHPEQASRVSSVQRYDSPEHVTLGDQAKGPETGLIRLECHDRDLPQRRRSPAHWPEPWQLYAAGTPEQKRAITEGLTYGEVVALSGDFYEDFHAMTLAPLREIYTLVPLIRAGATTEQLQAATGGRYLALAQDNEQHFSSTETGRSNTDTWRSLHAQAIAAARKGNANLAWGLNATADHFLTDAFAGGHLRVPRSALKGNVADNIESKLLHDLDNEHGVVVRNERGDAPWMVYGDNLLGDPRNARNRELALEAVRLSKQEIEDALTQRERYPEPRPGVLFAAQRLVPRPLHPEQDRWSGRTPTFQVDPSTGHPYRVADDYTRARDRLVRSEGPSVLGGILRADDDIRAWVNVHREALERQSIQEKIRMIETLFNGWMSEEDLRAIELVVGSVGTETEMAQLRERFEKRLLELQNLGQRTRMRIALMRQP
ncbi:MAG TPA: DUF4157 domain-containing protein [Polyangia bacterium]|jgi:hypothetical protein|nr:DUF4157 domain-containing protein [Polyangia bacterium]